MRTLNHQVVVLKDGEILESGPPSALLQREGGAFATMLKTF